MSIHTLHDGSFDHVIGTSPIPVVVLFTSPICVPCKSMIPILHEIAQEYEDEIHTAQLDITTSPRTTQKYAISSVPTILYFYGGEVIGFSAGVQSAARITELVGEILESIEDQ